MVRDFTEIAETSEITEALALKSRGRCAAFREAGWRSLAMVHRGQTL
jgi:hypothetical protein